LLQTKQQYVSRKFQNLLPDPTYLAQTIRSISTKKEIAMKEMEVLQ